MNIASFEKNVEDIDRMNKFRILLSIILVFCSVWLWTTRQTTQARTPVPQNRPEFGLIYDDLRSSVESDNCGAKFVLPDGTCTHGPDPLPPGADINIDTPPIPRERINPNAPQAVCDGDGTNGKRVQVLYVRASDKADRYSQYLDSIRQWVADMDNYFDLSAQKTGGTLRLRFVTDANCNVVVGNAVVGTTGDDTFSNTINAVKALGYNLANRKYLMFVDAGVYCGIAQLANDDRASADNVNNVATMYGRVDNVSGCWNARVAAHELMHTLGAVQDSAPNTTNGLNGSSGGHCTDEYDIMCYSDAGGGLPPMNYLCPSSQEYRFDCNDDDYFSANPPSGSYLATHWNTAKSGFALPGNGAVATPTQTSIPPQLTPTNTPVAPVSTSTATQTPTTPPTLPPGVTPSTTPRPSVTPRVTATRTPSPTPTIVSPLFSPIYLPIVVNPR
jgi:hypothetical protein